MELSLEDSSNIEQITISIQNIEKILKKIEKLLRIK